jgi:hypothetical protein
MERVYACIVIYWNELLALITFFGIYFDCADAFEPFYSRKKTTLNHCTDKAETGRQVPNLREA